MVIFLLVCWGKLQSNPHAVNNYSEYRNLFLPFNRREDKNPKLINISRTKERNPLSTENNKSSILKLAISIQGF